ncbi:MAG: ImmA/IrrE family metallo-endopeptidase [Burkholderiaceae bacterium]
MSTQIRVLKTDGDHAAAVARLSELMDKDPAAGSADEAELELLALLIQSYEQTKFPPTPPDPIEAILFRMDQQRLAHKDLVPYIGSMSKVSEVLSRKRPLSLAMIRRLHAGLGIPADVLIGEGQELSVDWTVDYTNFPLAEMQERGLFGPTKRPLQSLKEYAEELVTGFFRCATGLGGQPVMMRATLHQTGARTMDEYAFKVWQACVLRKARAMPLKGAYQSGVITSEWIRNLTRLSPFESGPLLAQEYLSNHGIALVFERHFDKTYLDGAAMLDGEAPIVALTLRHDRIDNFWFALLHELIHVQRHLTSADPCIADNLDDKTRTSDQELEADREAGEALIPEAAWASAPVRTSHSAEAAISLARQLQIHPAIVAGRVRKETENWRLLSNLISSAGKVTDLSNAQLLRQ